MNKLTLLIALSAFLCAAPGYTAGRETGDMNQALAKEDEAETQAAPPVAAADQEPDSPASVPGSPQAAADQELASTGEESPGEESPGEESPAADKEPALTRRRARARALAMSSIRTEEDVELEDAIALLLEKAAESPASVPDSQQAAPPADDREFDKHSKAAEVWELAHDAVTKAEALEQKARKAAEEAKRTQTDYKREKAKWLNARALYDLKVGKFEQVKAILRKVEETEEELRGQKEAVEARKAWEVEEEARKAEEAKKAEPAAAQPSDDKEEAPASDSSSRLCDEVKAEIKRRIDLVAKRNPRKKGEERNAYIAKLVKLSRGEEFEEEAMALAKSKKEAAEREAADLEKAMAISLEAPVTEEPEAAESEEEAAARRQAEDEAEREAADLEKAMAISLEAPEAPVAESEEEAARKAEEKASTLEDVE